MVKIDLLIAKIIQKEVNFTYSLQRLKCMMDRRINEIIHKTVYDIIETNFIYILQSAMVNFYAALYNSMLQMTCNKR